MSTGMTHAEYLRALEDAALVLWAEMGAEETLALMAEMPALADFLGHLHHSIEHEQMAMRRNVWRVDA